MLRQQNCWF
ncbi:hypothetical protein D039_3375A, partial [Vibrio parahaemolyticus EKP-028]